MSMEEAVQQSLFEEANRPEPVRKEKPVTAEDRKRMEQERKAAFRVAFDFLEKHMPPKNTEEFWNEACLDLSTAYMDHRGNRLCVALLVAVMNYLYEYHDKKEGD